MRTSPENLGKVRETAQIDTIILRLQPLANLALSLSRHLSQPDSSEGIQEIHWHRPRLMAARADGSSHDGRVLTFGRRCDWQMPKGTAGL
jgi:hypothetical protein